MTSEYRAIFFILLFLESQTDYLRTKHTQKSFYVFALVAGRRRRF